VVFRVRGTPLALLALLPHAAGGVRGQAVGACVLMAAQPPLAQALASAGAAPCLVELLAEEEPAAAPSLARALAPMLEVPSARAAALAAGGAASLCTAMLSCADTDGRLALALALAALVRGEWALAYEASGWPALLAILSLQATATTAATAASAPAADPAALHMDVARGAAGVLIGSPVARDALADDALALRFLARCLAALATQPGAADERTLAHGAAHAVTLALQCEHAEVHAEALSVVPVFAEQPPLASALASTGAAPAIVRRWRAAEPTAVASLARALRSMLGDETARSAALAAGGAAALGAALTDCADADGRLALALTLAALVRGDVTAVESTAGWSAVLAVLCTAAAAAAPEMREFAVAAGTPLLAALDDVPLPSRRLGDTAARPAPPAPSRGGVASHQYSFDTDDGRGGAPRASPSTGLDLD